MRRGYLFLSGLVSFLSGVCYAIFKAFSLWGKQVLAEASAEPLVQHLSTVYFQPLPDINIFPKCICLLPLQWVGATNKAIDLLCDLGQVA